MSAFIVIIAFAVGFLLGVVERKVDNVQVRIEPKKMVKKVIQALKPESKSEVLITPSDADYEKEQSKEFYAKMR